MTPCSMGAISAMLATSRMPHHEHEDEADDEVAVAEDLDGNERPLGA